MTTRKDQDQTSLVDQIHHFQRTGLVGLRTATAAALAVAGQHLAHVLKTPESTLTTSLEALLGGDTVLEASRVLQLCQELELSTDQLMLELVLVARGHALAPISGFRVGVVGRGSSGTLYLGFNIEFPGQPLNQTLHAEQCLLSLALNNGETGLDALAASDPPSGNSRQFLNELAAASQLRVLLPSLPPTTLSELLPHCFGPEDLGAENALLASHPYELEYDGDDAVIAAAAEAAVRAYAPYSNCPSGIALATDTALVTGSCLENAAFNPSLSPLQAALGQLQARGLSYQDVRRAVLVERQPAAISQEGLARVLLAAVCPGVELEVHHV
ncbi:MAG: cytidine deaminase [Vulcanimicrobiota bacterium]